MSSPAVINAWTDEAKSDSKSDIDKAEVVVVNNNDEEAIYNSSLLLGLDLSQTNAVFNPSLSVLNPGEGLRLRPLQLGDFSTGFLQLLGQLTKVGDISQEQWEMRFRGMKNKEGTYFITVLEDIHTHEVSFNCWFFISDSIALLVLRFINCEPN